MESNKVIGLIFPVGGEAQAFLADRDRPYRDIREAVQGEYDENERKGLTVVCSDDEALFR